MEIVTRKIQITQVPDNVTEYKVGDIFTTGFGGGVSVTTEEGFVIPRSHYRVLEGDFFKFPQLTRKQAKAIKDATSYYNYSYSRVIKKYVVFELYEDLDDLYEIELDILISSLYNGYEVVPSEEELIQEAYDNADKTRCFAPAGSKEKVKAEGIIEGIDLVLKTKKITIEGINQQINN